MIHLAGASIGGRFTPERKREILSSRIGPTRALATLAARSPERLRAFVTASAVGFYGADRGDEILTEASDRGDGFLADVAAAWEDAAAPASAAGIRTVQVRTGIVQTPRGGMLRLLYPVFETGLGGPLGDGTGWLPWIEIDDLLDIYLRAVTDPGPERTGQRGRAGAGATGGVRADPRPGARQARADPGARGGPAAPAGRRGRQGARAGEPAGPAGGAGRGGPPVPLPGPGGRAPARPRPHDGADPGRGGRARVMAWLRPGSFASSETPPIRRSTSNEWQM